MLRPQGLHRLTMVVLDLKCQWLLAGGMKPHLLSSHRPMSAILSISRSFLSVAPVGKGRGLLAIPNLFWGGKIFFAWICVGIKISSSEILMPLLFQFSNQNLYPISLIKLSSSILNTVIKQTFVFLFTINITVIC